MMDNRKLLLTAYFLWFGIKIIHCSPNKNECTYGVVQKIRVADCSHHDRTTFPTDLKPDIEGIYLNGTEIEEMDETSFENLKSLKYLYLNHNGGMKITSNAFKPLSNLIVLDLSFDNVPDIYLPTSLEKLYLNTLKKTSSISKLFSTNSLKELKFLFLRGNDLDQVPSFGQALPSLETLDLGENGLGNFKLDGLAHLCSLKVLDIPAISLTDNCECLRLKKWIGDKKIKTSSNIECESSKNSEETCDASPSKDFLQKYESCEGELRKKKFTNVLISIAKICGIILAVIAVSFSCIVLYVSCNRKDFAKSNSRAYFCLNKRISL